MNSTPVYRMAGYCSPRSLQYLEALVAVGWPEGEVSVLRKILPMFESASVRGGYELAIKTCSTRPHPAHEPFLRELNEHVRLVAKAERDEALHTMAKAEGGTDRIAAQRLLMQVDGDDEGEVAADGSVHFTVKEARGEVQVTRGRAAAK